MLFRLGVCRYKLSSVSTAVGLFNEALELAERSGIPCDRLRSNILAWRSRCYRRQRDFEAAREDVERALELAEGLNDPRTSPTSTSRPRSSPSATATGCSPARTRSARRPQYEEIADRGERRQAAQQPRRPQLPARQARGGDRLLKDAFAIALEAGTTRTPRTRSSSLAQVHLRTGDVALAEEQARQALELLGDRVDHWTRSATRSSSSGARCSSRIGSTRPRTRSPPPSPASTSFRRAAIAPRRGSPRETWRRAAATTARRPGSTAGRRGAAGRPLLNRERR